MRIGSLKLNNCLVMAPMAGITNLPFRLMVKSLGAGLVTTEMVSAMGLIQGRKKTLDYLTSSKEEKPLAVQIFGSEPDAMSRAAQRVVDHGADIVDINMGCPVRKVVRTGAGAALLKDLDRAAALVTAVRCACTVPLTVKIRAGWSPERPVACRLARIIEDCGADALTVHARYATQGFSGQADWPLIRQVKEHVAIPVIGNGDVFDAARALRMRKETGCDGVMIGRGAVGKPWIFDQVLRLERGLPAAEPHLSARRHLIMEHFHLLSNAMGEHRAARAMRGLLLWYTKGLPHSSRFRGDIVRIKDVASLFSTMEAYFCSLEDDALES
jgi:nifR3 family TIM-barrel protein